MAKTKLLIAHHRHEHYRRYLEQHSTDFDVTSFDFRDPIPFRSHDAEILMCFHLPDGLLERLPRLRWIALAAAGFDHLKSRLPSGGNVIVTRATGTMPDYLAQYVLAHILAHLRNLRTVYRQQDAGLWRFVASALAQRFTLAVLGLGAIGSRVAETGRALGMRVLGARKNPAAPRQCDELYTGDSWRLMLPRCDFLVLSVPLTDETEGMINASALSSMKKSAVLINIARGKVVVEPDLIAALKEGIIGGAVLDVFNDEPLPADHPFWRMENVVVTPHCAGPSEEDSICIEFLDNFRRRRAGEPLLKVADLERGY